MHILSSIMVMMAVVMCVPAAADAVTHKLEWEWFLATGFATGTVGVTGMLATRTAEPIRLSLREGFLLTCLGWLVVAFVGALPFLALGISLTDAVFESLSALTTTGSTVLTGLDNLPPGTLLWRALLQWVGGIGILAVAILLLPLLRVGGMQVFRIESSDTSDLRLPNFAKTITGLMSLYVLLTVLCALLYEALGMTIFDAITHAMTTVSSGGFSTHDASFGYFENPALHWVAIVFMIVGALPFLLMLRAVYGSPRDLTRDQQVRGFLGFLAVTSVVMAFGLMHESGLPFFEALTLTTFNITSIVTTTGYASADYTTWGFGFIGVFLVLMFVGGCSGSTAGGVKIYRFQLLVVVVRAHIRQLVSPNRLIPLRYNGRALAPDVPVSVLAFLAVFVATIASITAILMMLGLDLVTAYSATVTAISNVGPGLGPVVGPAGNFQPLPDEAKWLLAFAMLAGRLEVLALLVVLDPDFWRN
ncbi:TrkH family potassium uptake protein [Roseospira marina]|uniref:Trk system potassium uptake protein n=1 Tax=Roseospira marina TaxID=140057 RepID=A0A5M6ID78_9PROT|nr:TrkH family potassium uptake protein [Roseospira marina]